MAGEGGPSGSGNGFFNIALMSSSIPNWISGDKIIIFSAQLTNGWRAYLVLTLLCCVLFLPGIASLPVTDRDEARFAQATRQMLESGDFVQISFQNAPRHKKPAGAYWAQAAAVKLLGDPAAREIWPNRVPSALAALCAVLLTFYFGAALLGRARAFLGALILASCVVVVAESHLAKADACLLFCVVLAQGAVLQIFVRGRDEPAFINAALFWIALGLGVLVKGPVLAAVCGLTLATLLVAYRDRGWFFQLRPAIGVCITSLIVAPWFLTVQRATQGAFVSNAVQGDILPKLIGVQESHGGFPGYYALLSFATFWPWSLFSIPALVTAWKKREDKAIGALLAWLVPAWIALEIVPTKLPHYSMPLFPALALLSAYAISDRVECFSALRWSKLLARIGLALWALVGALLAIALLGAPLYFDHHFSWAAMVCALAILCLIYRAVKLGEVALNPRHIVITAGLVLPLTLLSVLPSMQSFWPSRKLFQTIASELHAKPAELVAVGFKEPSLVFLAGTETKLLDQLSKMEELPRRCPAAIVVDSAKLDQAMQILGADASLKRIDLVSAFNYSKGKWGKYSVFLKIDC